MMDWDQRRRSRSGCSNDAPSARTRSNGAGTKAQLILPLATYAILLCLVPLVVCREVDTEMEGTDVLPLGPRGYVDVFSDSEIHHLPNHRKHHHTNNRIDDEDAGDSVKEWSSGRKRKLRGRSKSTKVRQSPGDNEFDAETLDKHVSITSSSPSSTTSLSTSSSSEPAQKRANIVNANLKYLEPDKKYFDYFPIEDVQLNYDPKEDDIRVVLLSGDESDEDVKRKKSKKFAMNSSSMKKVISHQRKKRETDSPGYDSDNKSTLESDVVERGVVESEGTGKTKRNAFGRRHAFLDFLESHRGNNLPQNNYDYSRPSFGYQGSSDNYYSRGTSNDPWNNRFTGPVNNFYLPAPLPFYSSSAPVVTNIFVFANPDPAFSPLNFRFPYPGIYQNPVVPSRDYLPPQPSGFYPSRPSGVRPVPPQPQPQPETRPQPKPEPQPDSNQDVNLGGRFGADDDRVIWDISSSNGRDTVESLRPSFVEPTQNAAAASASGPSTRKPPPPLIHRPDRPNRVSNTTPRSSTAFRDQSVRNKHVSSNRRRPGNKFLSKDDEKIMQLTKEIFEAPASNALESGGFGGNFEPRPPRPNQIRPTPPPAQSSSGSRPPPPSNIDSPSKCVWGILSCCARSNLAIRYACFEQLGCHGAFWDLNPCTDELQDAALEEAKRFFDRK